MFIRRWIVSKATLGVETDIRVQLYAKLQRLPLAFHSRWASGQLLSRITSDLSIIRRFLGFGLVFLGVNILQIVVVVAILRAPLLAARPGRGGLDRPGDLGVAADAEASTPGCPARCRTRPATSRRASRRWPTRTG